MLSLKFKNSDVKLELIEIKITSLGSIDKDTEHKTRHDIAPTTWKNPKIQGHKAASIYV